jgi:hypothetical protein
MPQWTNDMPGGGGSGPKQWLILVGWIAVGLVAWFIGHVLGVW